MATTEAAVVEPLHLRRFADQVTLVPPAAAGSRRAARHRRAAGPQSRGRRSKDSSRHPPTPRAERRRDRRRRLAGLRLRGGGRLEVVFVHQPGRPDSGPAAQPGLTVSHGGRVKVDSEQLAGRRRAYVPGDCAAAGVTRLRRHQVVTAACEGTAAPRAASRVLPVPDPGR